ncbi:MAG TPA: hypothetical protein ACHBX6_11790 [Arsenophonus nasoniae]|uniref:hypothetical protein n=1 Tax=Arsenophonus nasoniae TaxID=638 RepID=UPI003879DA58
MRVQVPPWAPYQKPVEYQRVKQKKEQPLGLLFCVWSLSLKIKKWQQNGSKLAAPVVTTVWV